MTPRTRWSRWRLALALLLAIPAVTAAWQWLRQFRTFRPDEPLLRARIGDRYGCIAADGVEVVPFVWERIDEFDAAGMAPTQRNDDDLWGWIDRIGKSVIPYAWDAAEDFNHLGLAQVKRGERCGMVDRRGREVVPCVWDDCEADVHGFVHCQRKTHPWHEVHRAAWLVDVLERGNRSAFQALREIRDPRGRLGWRTSFR